MTLEEWDRYIVPIARKLFPEGATFRKGYPCTCDFCCVSQLERALDVQLNRTTELTEEFKHLLRLLNGPHVGTVLKIYQIKHRRKLNET